MKNEDASNPALTKEIKDLQREIGKLSMLLAFKKLENDHPALERLADDIQRTGNTLRQEAARISGIIPHQCGNGGVCRALKTLSRILIIGCVGYFVSLLFDQFGKDESK